MNFDSTEHLQRIPLPAPSQLAVALLFNAGPMSDVAINDKSLKRWGNGIQAEKYCFFFSLQNLQTLYEPDNNGKSLFNPLAEKALWLVPYGPYRGDSALLHGGCGLEASQELVNFIQKPLPNNRNPSQ